MTMLDNELDLIQDEILARILTITTDLRVKTRNKKRKRYYPILSSMRISRALQGKNHPNYGKRTPTSVKSKISESLAGRSLSESHKHNISVGMSREWTIIDPDGRHHISYHLKDFCQKHDLSYKAMLAVSRGIIQRHKGGWICTSMNEQ